MGLIIATVPPLSVGSHALQVVYTYWKYIWFCEVTAVVPFLCRGSHLPASPFTVSGWAFGTAVCLIEDVVPSIIPGSHPALFLLHYLGGFLGLLKVVSCSNCPFC